MGRAGRAPVVRGAACLLITTALSWILALACPSRTTVQLVITDTGAIGRVNGAKESATIPAAELATGHFGWHLAGPADSLYFAPADATTPLVSWGRVGEWLQGLRPGGSWTFQPGTTPAGTPIQPGPWQALPAQPGGARAAADPSSTTLPKAHLNAELVAGRVSAGLSILTDAAGDGYTFLLRPERRGISWWRLAGGVPVAQMDADVYRPDFWASVADLVQELALALTAASVLAALALLLSLLVGTRDKGQGTRDEGRGVRGQGSGVRGPGPEMEDPGSVLSPQSSALNTQHATRNPQHVAPLLLPLLFAVLGLGATLAVCLGPLEGIPHVQDDVAYLWQAKIFALGRAWVPAPPFKEFFDTGFVLITDDRWFTKYPPGWPLLLVPGVWAGMPWLINPLCAGASLALIFAIGRRLYGATAGFWAALLGLTSPFFLFMSGSFMSHPSTMLATTAALYCFVRLKTAAGGQGAAVRDQGSGTADQGPPSLSSQSSILHTQQATRNTQRLWGLGAGFALGWAFISREATAVGVALPFLAWGLVDTAGALRDLLRGWGGPGRGRRTLRRLAPYALAVLGALPPLIVLGAVNQELLGSPFRLAQELVGSYDQLGFGPGFGPEEGGHTPALGLYNALVYLRTLEGDLFGWPAPLTLAPLLLALAAAPWRRWHAARWDLFLLGGFLGLAGIYFAWWSATTIFGPRYWYESLPFLLLLSGRGIQVLGRAVARAPHGDMGTGGRPIGARRFARRGAGPGRWVAATLVGVLVVFDLAQVLPGQVRAYTGYNDVDASSLRRVDAAHLDHAVVFVALDPAFPRRDYGKVFFANDPLLQGPVIYARDVDRIHNQALMHNFPGREAYYLPLTGPVHPGVGP